MTETLIRYEDPAPGVARIVLARVEKHNSLNPALIFAINEAFDRAVRDDSVKVIILAADGRNFSAGHDIADTVEQWLPGMLPYGERITIRQLLTMRSGLIDNNDFAAHTASYLADVRDVGLRRKLTALARRVAAHPTVEVSPIWWIRWAAWEPLLFEPGTGYHYSNIGYELLGLIATRASHTPVGELFCVSSAVDAPLAPGTGVGVRFAAHGVAVIATQGIEQNT